MLVELEVENLAILDRCRIRLGSGLTVLTGETGAGKSLLVDALLLVLGARADAEAVRHGESKATVSAVFAPVVTDTLAVALAELGVDLEDEPLFIQREVLAGGRSQARLQGRLQPASALKEIGPHLVDLHGQHESQTLLNPARHRELLDALPTLRRELLAEVGQAYAAWRAALDRQESLRADEQGRAHRLDLLQYQIGEIETAAPQIGESAEIEAALARHRNADRLAAATQAALQATFDGDTSAHDLTAAALAALAPAARLSPELQSVAEGLEAVQVQLQESAHRLRGFADSLEADPAVAEQLADRQEVLRRLQRKYGASEEEILRFLQDAIRDRDDLLDIESRTQEAESAEQLARQHFESQAAALTEARRQVGLALAQAMQVQLADLAMPNARFSVRVSPGTPAAHGSDEVEFLFSANAGEPPRPLARVASGGELSRLMLALKTAVRAAGGPPTLLFDEVDAGIGGRTATAVAQKLAKLAETAQVLVISHNAAIAARADHHFRIAKEEFEGRTRTRVTELSAAERIEEVARMLAGANVTDTVRASARELLSVR
jgi:DNA repair protein RecN (Recombination protein N)